MRQPSGQWNQFEGKAMAELHRGSGRFNLYPYPCSLEPPFDPYDRHQVNAWDCLLNNWQTDWQASGLVFNPGDILNLPEVSRYKRRSYRCVAVEQFAADESSIDKAMQLLLSLPRPKRPVAFEIGGVGSYPLYDHDTTNTAIIGWGEPYTAVQFTVHDDDADTIVAQLTAHYPNSAVHLLASDEDEPLSHLYTGMTTGRDGYGATFALQTAYCFPLKTFTRLDTDPLGLAITAMENLAKGEWAVLQVLFEPVTHDWGDNLYQAVSHPYKPGKNLFSDISERDVDQKITSPLFAVSIRVMARTRPVYDQLLGWASQYAAPPQTLTPICEDDLGDLSCGVAYRYPIQPGLLLNTQELASLVHLPGPSVTSERLRRVKTRTKASPRVPPERGSVMLGKNTHRGVITDARISAELRPRHCYIAGASGTGKSTLLLNMIRQDIESGAGVGVIDPHGDLIDGVLSLIPRQRIQDVAYFNPTDNEHPPAFNILSYRDKADRQRIASDTVATIHRFYPDAWGPRLEHILRHALITILKSRSATLMHLKRLLTDANYRQFIVDQLGDDNLRSFWFNEFEGFPKGSVDPILNKLSPFLLNPITRNIICQPKSSFDFDRLLNHSKIFLANLSKGSLGDEVAGVLGTFIMGRIVNAAFRRDKIPEHDRVPFYLYVDEFQNFMDLSVGFEQILAEARKYKLVLAGLANQYVGQLSQDVRQAVFGNVGTLLTFRLGVSDSRLIANEFGDFTPEEIMSLERGQAIARMGGTQTAFNLATPPPPDSQPEAIRREIIGRSQKKYTTPRAAVERSFQTTPSPLTSRPRQPSQATTIQPSPVPGSVHTPSTAPPKTPEYLAPDQPDDAGDFVS